MTEGTVMYGFLRLLARTLVRGYFRCSGRGMENIPASGSFILAANHVSYLDPFFIGAFCPRPVHYIMLKSFYEMPVIGPVCRLAGSFPVDPDGPALPALKRALSVLRDGRVLGIFPEGGRSPDGRLTEPRGGVSLLVLRGGYPLIPVSITGAERAFGKGMAIPRPRKVRIRFGKPLSLPEMEDGEARSAYLARSSGLVMNAIAGLGEGY